jgi:lysophospholipase L1-like esterase
MNKKVLIGFNVLTLCLLTVIVLKEHYPQKIWHYFKKPAQEENKKLSYWLNRDQLFKALPHDSNSIVFVGTSLTENFELTEIFHQCNYKNRGITSDVTEGILNRLDPIILDQPNKILIEAGINDLGKGVGETQMLSNYKAIIDRLQRECPKTQLLIQSIFPVANKGLYPNYNNSATNAAIVRANKALQALATNKGIIFIDLYPNFTTNGQIKSEYVIEDGIHFNGAAYNLWAQLLGPYLQ